MSEDLGKFLGGLFWLMVMVGFLNMTVMGLGCEIFLLLAVVFIGLTVFLRAIDE